MAELLVYMGSGRLNVGEYVPYRHGDVVSVKANPIGWGLREDKRKWDAANPGVPFPSDLAIVRVTDLAVADARKLVRQQWRPAIEGDKEFDAADAEDRFVRQNKRRWKFRVADLPGPKTIELNQTGYTEINLAIFRDLCDHKRKNVHFDETDPEGEGAPF